MNKLALSGLRTALLLFFGLGGLSACGPNCRLNQTPFELAALDAGPTQTGRPLPMDTWAPNPSLEAFLSEAVKTEGVGAVASKYHMQCAPKTPTTDCEDCLTCSTTFRDWRVGPVRPLLPNSSLCSHFGDMFVHVDFGSGANVTAMTYWKTTPEARKAVGREP